MEELNRAHALTGEMVDIGLFVGGRTRYEVPDVQGNPHTFELPTDLPFPTALSIEHAYDRVIASAQEQGDLEGAWDALCEAIASACSIVGENIAGSELRDRFGRNSLMHWSNVIITRLQMQQMGATLEQFLKSLAEPIEVPSDPKASASPTSSATSDG